jgi:hypothetical protein
MNHAGRAIIAEYCTALVNKDLAVIIASYWTNSYGRQRALEQACAVANGEVPVAWEWIRHLPNNVQRIGIRSTSCRFSFDRKLVIIYHDSVIAKAGPCLCAEHGDPGECASAGGYPIDWWPRCFACDGDKYCACD